MHVVAFKFMEIHGNVHEKPQDSTAWSVAAFNSPKTGDLRPAKTHGCDKNWICAVVLDGCSNVAWKNNFAKMLSRKGYGFQWSCCKGLCFSQLDFFLMIQFRRSEGSFQFQTWRKVCCWYRTYMVCIYIYIYVILLIFLILYKYKISSIILMLQ